MTLITLKSIAAFAICISAGTAFAQNTEMSSAEVRKIDAAEGKITLKHGPIPNLDMPGMTMVFRVREPVRLDTLKPGDNIRFRAEKINGNYTVTEIQAAP